MQIFCASSKSSRTKAEPFPLKTRIQGSGFIHSQQEKQKILYFITEISED